MVRFLNMESMWLNVFCTTQGSKIKILRTGFHNVQEYHNMQNYKVCKDNDAYESF